VSSSAPSLNQPRVRFDGGNSTFSKLKAILRKAAARSLDDLWRTIGTALPQFTPAECANLFTAAGYRPE
jgi:TPP-dependent 2-oxoacid decarboxylase